jgi:ABC-type transport system substrate-binding protein
MQTSIKARTSGVLQWTKRRGFWLLGLLFACALTLADPASTGPIAGQLRLAISGTLPSFDPIAVEQFDARRVHELVYQRLMTYAPSPGQFALIPQLALAPPLARKNGLQFDVQLSTARFNPAHGSALAPRAVRASDVVYSFQRLMRDCKPDHAQCALLRKNIRSVRALGIDSIRFDLHASNYDFPYLLALPSTAIVAPEGISAQEFFGSHDFQVHAIDHAKLTLRRVNALDDGAALILKNADSRTLPLREIMISSGVEKSAQLAQFLRGELDILDQLGPLERDLIPNQRLNPALRQARARLNLLLEPEIIYYYLTPTQSAQDAQNTEAQLALRKAVLHSYPVADEIARVRFGLGVPSTHYVPPEFPEQGPSGVAYEAMDFASANALLDAQGFARDVTGWRAWPDGAQLTLSFTSELMAVVAPFQNQRRAQLAALGIRMQTELAGYSNNLQRAAQCQAPFWGAAWSALVPTPGYVLQVLRSDEIGASNLSCYRNAAFDQLHAKAQASAPGPARAAMYAQLGTLLQRDAVWQMGVRRQRATLIGPRVINFSSHAMLLAPWQDIRLIEPNHRATSTAPGKEEWTFIQAKAGQSVALAQFIEDNWFAMDRVAQQRGLIQAFSLLENAEPHGEWQLAVRVRYHTEHGYAAIAPEFEQIRAAHTSVLIDEKTFADLGTIVAAPKNLSPDGFGLRALLLH